MNNDLNIENDGVGHVVNGDNNDNGGNNDNNNSRVNSTGTLTGGPLFTSHVVHNIINWATFSQYPCFVIITDWTYADNDHVEQHISPVIQYEAHFRSMQKRSCQGKKRKIEGDDITNQVTNNDGISPIFKSNGDDDEGYDRWPYVTGGRWILTFVEENYVFQPDNPENRKLKLDMKAMDKRQFYFQKMGDVLALLKASMEVDLWGAGMPILDDFEMDPRIHTLGDQGYVTPLPINTTRDNAACFDDWISMIECQLRIIRLLSENCVPF